MAIWGSLYSYIKDWGLIGLKELMYHGIFDGCETERVYDCPKGCYRWYKLICPEDILWLFSFHVVPVLVAIDMGCHTMWYGPKLIEWLVIRLLLHIGR